MATKPKHETLISRTADWLSQYVVFPNEFYATVVATWAIGTHCWPLFDAFGYLVITARTKRAGKSRLGVELLQYIVSNGSAQVAPTPASMFREIDAEHPTMIFDESESMGSEAKTVMHALQNVGYKRGQKIKRAMGKTEYKAFDVYCPKVFILIGHPSDTLRDRSFMIEMSRSMESTTKRYDSATVRDEANKLRAEISAAVNDQTSAIADTYQKEFADWLVSERDEEIWRSMLSVAKTFGSDDEYEIIRRASVDISAMKSAPAITIDKNQEKMMEQLEYAHRLIQDVIAIADTCKGKYRNGIRGTELLDELQALTLSPWRKYQGVGLDINSLAELMRVAGVSSSGANIITETFRRGKDVVRGYNWKQIERLRK